MYLAFLAWDEKSKTRNYALTHCYIAAIAFSGIKDYFEGRAVAPPSNVRDDNKGESDFLVKDYELRIGYLSDHFTRMWNRFNYFVAIESALVSGKFFLGNGRVSKGVAVVGAVLAFVWYVMGAEDRYLVQVYRKQVKEAGARVAQSLLKQERTYSPVGDIEQTEKNVPKGITGWRLEAISTTKLASLIPLLLTFTWIAVLICERG